MTPTFWETENAMQISRIAATRARSAAANAVGGEVVSTEELEIAVDVTGIRRATNESEWPVEPARHR